jgi:hypothetical protein
MTGAEGENLIVNKNLIELLGVLAVFSFRTGWIAGLDHLWLKPQRPMGVAGVGV